MKICSFNVNSIRARKDLIFNWLDHRGHDLDVICFQELKVISDDFPKKEFEDLGYSCAVFGQKAYNGVAVCSRIPMEEIQRGFGIPEWDDQSRLLKIVIDSFTLFNVYAPRGDLRETEKFAYKQEWYRVFTRMFSEGYSPQKPLVVVGDFNVARRDVDVYSAEDLADTIGTMPEERARFEDLLAWGFTDGYQTLHPKEQLFTWWGYMGGAIWRNEGMRIDYVLITKPLIDRLREVEVDLWPRRRRSPTPSDHAPVIADFDL